VPKLAPLIVCMFAAAGIAAAAGPALAGGLVDEVRLGVLQQNIEPRGHEQEYGFDLNGEIFFAPLFARTGDHPRDAFSVRPVIGGSYNLSRTTDMLYADLNWHLPLATGFFLEIGAGGALHDGALESDTGGSEYGCRVNFHESAALGYDIDEHWRLTLEVDHMSNARLCSRNRGLTNGGVRLGYQFD